MSSIITDDTRSIIKTIAFKANNTKLGDVLFKKKQIHIAGRLKLNEFMGKKEVQLHVEDASLVSNIL